MTTIVLAAGRSRRFGRANKLLADIRGAPLIVQTVRRILTATDGPVCVVVGHQARQLRAALARHGLCSPRLRIVHNQRACAGLAGSLARGLVAAPRISSAVQIHLSDVPGVERQSIFRLRRALNDGAVAGRLVHQGRPGHPVRLRRQCLPPIATISEQGLKPVFRALPDGAQRVIEAGSQCVADVDRRQTRRAYILRLERRRNRFTAAARNPGYSRQKNQRQDPEY